MIFEKKKKQIEVDELFQGELAWFENLLLC